MSFVDNPNYTAEQRAAMKDWHQKIDATNKASAKRSARSGRDPIGGFFAFLQLIWASLTSFAMYSSDPTLARQAMVYNAEKQIGIQRQMAAQQREEDFAREEAKMRYMGRVMADEMMARVNERR